MLISENHRHIPQRFQKRPVAFLAPGSGLGHLVRTGALCLGLLSRGIPSVIFGTSAYGPGFSRLTGLDVVTLPMSQWKDVCLEHVKALDPVLLVQDTFPCGLKGENFSALTENLPLIILSRRLRFSAYQNALKAIGPVHEPQGFSTLIMEPLEPDHMNWLEQRARTVTSLENRIRFPWPEISLAPVPRKLEQAHKAKNLHLVVHSGPEEETIRLIDLAEKNIKNLGDGHLAVINPRMAARNNPMCFDYFPAAALYDRAEHIYTGAGFNAVSETADFVEKHTMLAFPRHYDDQVWRMENKSYDKKPGNKIARDMIENLYNQEQKIMTYAEESPGE